MSGLLLFYQLMVFAIIACLLIILLVIFGYIQWNENLMCKLYFPNRKVLLWRDVYYCTLSLIFVRIMNDSDVSFFFFCYLWIVKNYRSCAITTPTRPPHIWVLIFLKIIKSYFWIVKQNNSDYVIEKSYPYIN